MPEHVFAKVYALPNVNWDTAFPVNNGAPVGTTFTLKGGGDPMNVLDDDLLLEDNVDAGAQTRDATQQTLTKAFGSNSAGDYVWSRAFQTVTDQFGNTGRIYQIRISEWSPGDPGLPDSGPNTHTYYAFSGNVVVTPGVTFTVTGGFNPLGNQSYSEFAAPVCFSAETSIETADGPIAANELAVGTTVQTRDSGLQTVRWIGQRTIGRDELAAAPRLRPVRIRAGALGPDKPARDLVVSPQHRVLVRSKIAMRLFDTTEILVAAKQLLSIEGVEVADDIEEVTYVHFMFDKHEIVIANGAETESLYAGEQALRMIGNQARAELFLIFPELSDRRAVPTPARLIVNGKMARKLASRHAKNGIDLVCHGNPS